MKVVRTRIYERKATKLLSTAEMIEAENHIISAPKKWPIVSGTGGIRKARAARGDSGKSGGARILYYFWFSEEKLYFLDIYAKNEKENLSDRDKKLLKGMIQELIGDPHG